MTAQKTEQTFISRSDVPEHGQGDEVTTEIVTIPVEDWATRMTAIANGAAQTVQVTRRSDRRKAQVVDALNDAFELIGGVPRLAIWANTNPTEFYKLWGKLAPKDIATTVEASGELQIMHVLPPGPLDK